VIFSNTKYFLRSSKDGQYVFTPRGQEDPKRWTDLILYSAVDVLFFNCAAVGHVSYINEGKA
jgi:hypothetical protein